MHQTTLTVNILVKDETRVLALSIVLVTKLFFLLWRAGRFVSSVSYELSMLVADAKAAISFTSKVLAICLSALLFGLGMKR
jgi:hypothetical protein